MTILYTINIRLATQKIAKPTQIFTTVLLAGWAAILGIAIALLGVHA